MNGNLAMQPKRKPDQKTVIRETKRVVVKRKSLPTQEKLLYLFSVVVVVAVLCAILIRQTQIYDMSVNIKQMNNEYESMNVEMIELKRQVEMLSNPERIRKLAEEQGMAVAEDAGITVKTSDGTASAMNANR
ncbi:cell division protein FtsL [Paenibacillus sp. NPDC058071]|uniref:cell division protein FtsL n=1 Tax=Paenibacillus sp. NPDC058071 TaxID=3346326 RepID=UPI0036DF1FCD